MLYLFLFIYFFGTGDIYYNIISHGTRRNMDFHGASLPDVSRVSMAQADKGNSARSEERRTDLSLSGKNNRVPSIQKGNK